MTETSGDGKADGRHAKRTANRDAAVRAALELFREGDYLCEVGEIAERAGLSARSLHRYFSDGNDLLRAVMEHQRSLMQPHVRIDVHRSDPTEVKIRRVVAARLKQYEIIGPAARASRVRAPRNPVLAGILSGGRAEWRNELRTIFSPELAAGGTAAATALAAADVLLSLEAYDLLRLDQGLSRAKTEAVLVAGLQALLMT